MPRNATGNYSLPSSVNPVVGNTPITAQWAHITLPDIANEITKSLDRNNSGAMLAPLRLSSGTVAAPGLTFSAETNSGLYRAGAGDLRVGIAGTDRLTLTASQLSIAAALSATGVIKGPDGAVGAPAFTFTSDTDTGIYRAGADDLRIVAGGTEFGKVNLSGAGAGKVSLSAATAATGGTRQDALTLTNGDLDLSGVAAPTSTTAIANRLTPLSFLKAWAVVSCDGAATFTPTVDSGVNVASVARNSGNSITITWAQAFANANYGFFGLAISGGGSYLVTVNNAGADRVAGSIKIALLDTTTGGAHSLDADGVVRKIFIGAIGAQ